MDSNNTKVELLHICPDFPSTKIYDMLISHLMKHKQNKVYVAMSRRDMSIDYPVYWGRDFGVIDRILFFRKQHVIRKDIEKKGLCQNCRLIHAHNLFSGGYTARILSLKYGIPYIVAVRNTDVNVFFQHMIHLRPIGVKIMLDASAIVFISPAYKKRVLEDFVPKAYRGIIDEKSYVIPNGIDNLFLKQRPNSARRLLPDKTIRLIYVGEVNNNKNLTTTIRACEILRERGYRPSLVVVGPITDPKYEVIKNNSYVDYHPQCSKEEVISYLRSSDIFVMPSLKETFGLVYVEAMSQGVPIIYSQNQGIDGYFEEGFVGYHIDCRRANDIADAVLHIMADYSAFSIRCIEAAKNFSWESIAVIYNDLYNKIINSYESNSFS